MSVKLCFLWISNLWHFLMDLSKEVSKEKPWSSERLKNYCSRARKKITRRSGWSEAKKIGLDFWGFCCCFRSTCAVIRSQASQKNLYYRKQILEPKVPRGTLANENRHKNKECWKFSGNFWQNRSWHTCIYMTNHIYNSLSYASAGNLRRNLQRNLTCSSGKMQLQVRSTLIAVED